MSGPRTGCYVEPGASWRAFWLAAGLLAGVLAVLALLGTAVPGLLRVVAVVGALGVLGVVAVGTVSARRTWTVQVAAEHLRVGRESVPLADVDAAHLAAARSGVDAGAPVLGGGWSLPTGRAGLPLRLTDGRTVLVPTSDPTALRAAVLASRGTMGP